MHDLQQYFINNLIHQLSPVQRVIRSEFFQENLCQHTIYVEFLDKQRLYSCKNTEKLKKKRKSTQIKKDERYKKNCENRFKAQRIIHGIT